MSEAVIFISRQRLAGGTSGSSAYLIDLARTVREAGLEPHLIQPSPTLMGRLPIVRLGREMRLFESHSVRGVWRVGDRLIARDPAVYLAVARALVSRVARRLGVRAAWTLDRPMPYAISIPWTPADHAFVRAKRPARSVAVIADYMFQAEGLADAGAPPLPSAIVMHDLFHARAGTSRTGQRIDSVAQVDRAHEIALLRRADAVIAIQETEARFVAEAVAGVEAILTPMAAEPVAAAAGGEDDRLLFVGSNTAPNVVGLEWFFDTVWPLVRAARPDARLAVAGTVARAFGGRTTPAGVALLGLVDDLAPLYARAGIVISPLTFGSGLKIKLVEALAAGKAIVATGITMQGVEAACDGAVIVADEPDAFARAIVELAGDAGRRAAYAEAALGVARTHFSRAASHAAFRAWLDRVALGERAV